MITINNNGLAVNHTTIWCYIELYIDFGTASKRTDLSQVTRAFPVFLLVLVFALIFLNLKKDVVVRKFSAYDKFNIL